MKCLYIAWVPLQEVSAAIVELQVLGQGLGVDFTFASNKNINNNNEKKKKNPRLT